MGSRNIKKMARLSNRRRSAGHIHSPLRDFNDYGEYKQINVNTIIVYALQQSTSEYRETVDSRLTHPSDIFQIVWRVWTEDYRDNHPF